MGKIVNYKKTAFYKKLNINSKDVIIDTYGNFKSSYSTYYVLGNCLSVFRQANKKQIQFKIIISELREPIIRMLCYLEYYIGFTKYVYLKIEKKDGFIFLNIKKKENIQHGYCFYAMQLIRFPFLYPIRVSGILDLIDREDFKLLNVHFFKILQYVHVVKGNNDLCPYFSRVLYKNNNQLKKDFYKYMNHELPTIKNLINYPYENFIYIYDVKKVTNKNIKKVFSIVKRAYIYTNNNLFLENISNNKLYDRNYSLKKKFNTEEEALLYLKNKLKTNKITIP